MPAGHQSASRASRAPRSPRSSSRTLRAPLVVAFGGLVLALGASACGSRGPLDLGPTVIYADASADASIDVATDVSDAATDTAVPPEAAVDAQPEASIIDCGACVATTCGQDIVKCLTDTACRTVLTCVAQTCLAGGGGAGGLDPSCIFTCAGGDSSAIATLVGIFTCVTQKCGPDCGSVLGGLGGLGGGGGFPGSGNAPSPNDLPQDQRGQRIDGMSRGERIFSAYPELFSTK